MRSARRHTLPKRSSSWTTAPPTAPATLLQGPAREHDRPRHLPRREPGQGRRAAHRLRGGHRRRRHHPGRRSRVRPAGVPELLEPILEGKADVVFGSRFTGGEPHRVLYFWHCVGNSVLTVLSNMFTNLNLTDMETCYKVFRREVLQRIVIEENRFGFEPEITAKIAKLRLPHLRGRHHLLRPHLRRGQEDRLEGRRARPLLHREVQRVSLGCSASRRLDGPPEYPQALGYDGDHPSPKAACKV